MKAKTIVLGITLFVLCGLQATEMYAKENNVNNKEFQKHVQWSEILADHVDNRGLVDYGQVCIDKRFSQYLTYLSATQWQTMNQNNQLAFWINAYNAFTVQAICGSYPIESINNLHSGGLIIGTVFKSTIWDKKFFSINGQKMSLGYIEHEILRKGPEKARIHFAIVCAAVSCPPLRQEAYEGFKISEQLNDQGHAFLARKDLNSFNLNTKTAYLSGIFKWFKKDFGRNSKELLYYLANYAPSNEIAESLRKNTKEWSIRWKKYDWSLNDNKNKN